MTHQELSKNNTEVPSETEGPKTKGPQSSTREPSSGAKKPKCEPVTVMEGCNARCVNGTIRCLHKLKEMDFQGNLEYFSANKLSDAKYVRILWEDFKYYFANFVRKEGGGEYPPNWWKLVKKSVEKSVEKSVRKSVGKSVKNWWKNRGENWWKNRWKN